MAVLLGCAPSPAAEPAGRVLVSDEAATSGDAWRATEVVDGDTLYLAGPLGQLQVRIIGINTPELGECFSDEATDALVELVDGNDLVVVSDQTDLDQFDRALRYVETVDGVDVGAELVAGGFAIARRYPPDDARADVYARLQAAAQDEQRGLWAPDACGDSDLDGVEIGIEVNADAPGDDSENLNGEWVRFTNNATERVDLDGWEVADESASHRHTFSGLELDPGASVTLFTGCADDMNGDDTTGEHGAERFWCASGSAVWNNSGDTVFLRDANGNIAATFAYGDSA